MFCNWISYVMKKKRKAKRYIDAMDAYRTQLLADGVSQWIKVTISYYGVSHDWHMKLGCNIHPSIS